MAGPQRKPQADIYTALLAIALAAILLAILFLYLETADYGPNKYTGAPPVARLDLPATSTNHASSQRRTPSAVNTTAGFRVLVGYSRPRRSVTLHPNGLEGRVASRPAASVVVAIA